MLKQITITSEDIVQQVKLSGQLTEITEQIVTRKIIINAAKEAEIKVENDDLQKAADQFRLANNLVTAKDTHEWLEKNQLSVDEFEEIIEINLISSKLMQQLFADKVEPYFYQNQLDYAGAIIYEIIFDDEDMALEIYYSIQEEEISFYEAAKQYITDTELQRKCGYLGRVKRQDLKPEISAKVFGAKPPQMLKPIITSDGVYLILVEEIITPELDNNLRLQIMSDLFNNWLEEQKLGFEIIEKLDC